MKEEARLKFTARARRDLDGARAWLMQPGSGRKAHNRYVAILRALLDLRHHPLRWATSEHIGVRKRSVEGHVLLYQISRDGEFVTVLRRFGPYQDRTSL